MDAKADAKPRNSRDAILDAAEQVVRDKGSHHLTIDAVARESGLSKGGVLYNFPSKQALLEGMVDRAIECHVQRVETTREALKGPNRTLRAMLASRRDFSEKQPVARAYLAATAENPELVDRITPLARERYEQIMAECADGDMALVLWMALEGIVLLDVIGLQLLPDDAVERVERRLIRIAEQLGEKG